MADGVDRAKLHTALVWQDEHHDLMVAVGERIWPLVEQTENGELGIEARIGETLRQQGWRPVPGAEHDRSKSGVLRIPIERIPTNDDTE